MKKIILLLAFCGLLGGTAQAQTILNSTTLNGAVTRNATTITLTSVTVNIANGAAAFSPAIAVGQQVVVADEGGVEAMVITAISGTTLTVQRGQRGTAQKAHSTGEIVFVGVVGAFYNNPPGGGSGSDPGSACTRATLQYLPWIDLNSGIIWTCGSQGAPATASTWTAVNPMPITFNSTGWLR